MADLGADRRELMVELDPDLDRMLPTARSQPSAYRDYQGRVWPGSFPVTEEVVESLVVDYDLGNASVRSLTARPTDAGLEAQLTLAAPRRFSPSMERVAPDGSRKPWPAALLKFTFTGVTDISFDAEDRKGMAMNCADGGPSVIIGQAGRLQAAYASIWPDDPRWHESTAGQAADVTAPQERPERQKPARTSIPTSQQRATALALATLMRRVRLVFYYPKAAARVPVREICRTAAGAGTAILAASARQGAARRKAFAELEERWRHVPPDLPPAPVRPGPAMLRYAGYTEPHERYDNPRQASAILLVAVPDADAAARWNLASEEVAEPSRFRITSNAFDGIQQVHRDAEALSVGDGLVVQPQGQQRNY